MEMPVLETERLLIRPFLPSDLQAVQHILGVAFAEVDMGSEGTKTLPERRHWLEWTVLSYSQLAALYQPPYGDRAVTLKADGVLVGAVGFVPSFGPFGQLPSLGGAPSRNTAEFGLYYVISPVQQRKGYAFEAVEAMVDYAFRALNLQRLVATTTYGNAASIGLMSKLGMRVEHNPYPDPTWFHVVGILENPG